MSFKSKLLKPVPLDNEGQSYKFLWKGKGRGWERPSPKNADVLLSKTFNTGSESALWLCCLIKSDNKVSDGVLIQFCIACGVIYFWFLRRSEYQEKIAIICKINCSLFPEQILKLLHVVLTCAHIPSRSWHAKLNPLIYHHFSPNKSCFTSKTLLAGHQYLSH